MTDRYADVLLVEDNADDAEFTLRALARGGEGELSIAVAEDGVAALDFMFATGRFADRATEGLPRVVLLDLKLPRIDGLEVLQRLKSDERTRGVPVVVLTSSRERRDIREAYQRGANSYVVKPVEYAELTAKLADIVRYWLGWNRSATGDQR